MKWDWKRTEEIVGSVIWVASIVEVFGFTFESFKQTYRPYPLLGGANATKQGLDQAVKAAAAPFGGNPKADASGAKPITHSGSGGILGGITGSIIDFITGNREATVTVPTRNLPSKSALNPLMQAIRANNPGAISNALLNLENQQKRYGWNQADFYSWLTAQSWYGNLESAMTAGL